MSTLIGTPDPAPDPPLADHEADMLAAVMHDLEEADFLIGATLLMARTMMPEHLYQRLLQDRQGRRG